LLQDKSSELILPPINKTTHRTHSSSLSFDDTHVNLPAKKKQRISDIQSPTSVNKLFSYFTSIQFHTDTVGLDYRVNQ
jgi:hypothetical protein